MCAPAGATGPLPPCLAFLRACSSSKASRMSVSVSSSRGRCSMSGTSLAGRESMAGRQRCGGVGGKERRIERHAEPCGVASAGHARPCTPVAIAQCTRTYKLCTLKLCRLYRPAVCPRGIELACRQITSAGGLGSVPWMALPLITGGPMLVGHAGGGDLGWRGYWAANKATGPAFSEQLIRGVLITPGTLVQVPGVHSPSCWEGREGTKAPARLGCAGVQPWVRGRRAHCDKRWLGAQAPGGAGGSGGAGPPLRGLAAAPRRCCWGAQWWARD